MRGPFEKLRAGGPVLAMTGLLSATSCGGSGEPTVDVLAASSFVDVAVPLEALLEDVLDIDIRFSFGSSGSFLEQLNQGAPASVVITADTATMQRIEDAGLAAPSVAITGNELVIITADTDAGRAIESFADLARGSDAVLVVCASSAPCGAATDAVAAQAGVELAPASREPNVRATLTKVLLGEADAAIVYRTDAVANPDLRTVEIGEANVSVVGRAAVTTDPDVNADTTNSDTINADTINADTTDDATSDGAAIIDVLTGERAAAVFAEAGFSAP